MKPPISVIMPCFNHEPFVRDAVSSVLSQTLSDFEIIAIDDCSDDATAERLEEFDDPRLTVIRHADRRGLAKTINEGIRRSRGNYISILNSDHLYHPERLKYCLEMCETHDFYLIGTDVDVIWDDTEEPNTEKTDWLEGHHRVRNEHLASQDLTSTMMAGNLFITTSNLFCRRSLFDAIGPLADHLHVEDYDFILRSLVAYPSRVHWSEHRMLVYRLPKAKNGYQAGLSPSQQTLMILVHWMSHLASGEKFKERMRIAENHLLRLASEIEADAAQQTRTQWQAEVASYQKVIERGKRMTASLEKERDEALTRIQIELALAKEGSSKLGEELAMTRSEQDTLRERLETAQSEAAATGAALLVSLKREVASETHNRMLAARCDDLSQDLEEHQRLTQSLRASRSYRLGRALLLPLRLIRQFFRR